MEYMWTDHFTAPMHGPMICSSLARSPETARASPALRPVEGSHAATGCRVWYRRVWADPAQHGYAVTGLDLSIPLLLEAQKRTNPDEPLMLVCGISSRYRLPHTMTAEIRCPQRPSPTPAWQQVFLLRRVLRPGGCSSWMSATGRRQWPKRQEPVFEKSVVTPQGTLTFAV